MVASCAPPGHHYEVGSFVPTPNVQSRPPAPPLEVQPQPVQQPPTRPPPRQVQLPSIPIENDAVLFRSEPDDLVLIRKLAELVRANDYACDSVSAARPMLTSPGFVLSCNKFRYKYDIQDKGGRWVVTVP
ncbi:MAG: hypothetical protein NTV56_22755 [Alphaproteobacteria bacterium]|nr:hypothetical protein [Alphaproteobacteria bacterium]